MINVIKNFQSPCTAPGLLLFFNLSQANKGRSLTIEKIRMKSDIDNGEKLYDGTPNDKNDEHFWQIFYPLQKFRMIEMPQ